MIQLLYKQHANSAVESPFTLRMEPRTLSAYSSVLTISCLKLLSAFVKNLIIERVLKKKILFLNCHWILLFKKQNFGSWLSL